MWRLLSAYYLLLGAAFIVLAIVLDIPSVGYRLSMIALGLVFVGPPLWRFVKSRWFIG